MSARSSSSRYTAASSAGARPTSKFSASTGTKPASNSSSRAAEYFAAQPPQEARSVSLTWLVSASTEPPSGGGLENDRDLSSVRLQSADGSTRYVEAERRRRHEVRAAAVQGRGGALRFPR